MRRGFKIFDSDTHLNPIAAYFSPIAAMTRSEYPII